MSLFSFENLFRAYLDCRKNKRNKTDALRFEINAEENLFNLCRELQERTYRPSSSVCFVTQKPKLREIFAADFQDRILHHLVVRYLEKIWEPLFIYDAYASRQGKGIHLAAKRIQGFMRKATSNGTRNAYYMQLDIKNFFMRINKDILYELIKSRCPDKEILWLAQNILYHDPTKNYELKCSKSLLSRIPKQKSLFENEEHIGLPIGNLTSQFFANVYLNGVDQFVKHTLKCHYYGRYVDDFLLIDRNKDNLISWRKEIEKYLDANLMLELNALRTKIMPVKNGVDFLGYIIRSNYTLCRNRVVNNLKEKLKYFENRLIRVEKGVTMIRFDEKTPGQLFTCLNSYLGHFRHANTYHLIQSLFKKFPFLNDYFSYEKGRLTRLFITSKRFKRLRHQYIHFFFKYEPPVLIFFQIGCFYEFYDGQASLAVKILKLKWIKRKYRFRRRCGFGVTAMNKYLNLALQSGYFVVVIRQSGYTLGNIAHRTVALKYEPCMQPQQGNGAEILT